MSLHLYLTEAQKREMAKLVFLVLFEALISTATKVITLNRRYFVREERSVQECECEDDMTICAAHEHVVC